MQKELPFFKFFPAKWQMGTIVHETAEIQCVFINVCCFYWQRKGSVTLTWLKQRLSIGQANNSLASTCLDCLLSKQYLLHNSDTDEITIKFLKEQMEELLGLSEKRILAGKKGGKASVKQRLSKRQANVNDSSSIKEEDKDKEEDTTSLFDLFWTAYPKKKSKGDAERAWKKLKPNKLLTEKIIKTISNEKESVQWKKDGGQFIPYPASWLNSKGWENEPEQPIGIKKHEWEDPAYYFEGERDILMTSTKEEHRQWRQQQIAQKTKQIS